MGKDTQLKEARGSALLKTKVVREFSSGGVVFKKEKGKILWLITATNPNKLFPNVAWRLPKGWIDNESAHVPGPMASGKIKADEASLQESALREVSEEGGVEAEIIQKIGSQKYFFKHPTRGQILKFITFYLMEYIRDLPDGHDDETSEVLWLTFKEAYKKLSFGTEKQILNKANEALSQMRRGRDSNPR
jgi:8-oxo-dGTP pyrophosphatase MutT (NUDIX family)